MKTIMSRGTLIVFSVGVLVAIIAFVLDFLTNLFKPLITPWLNMDYLVTPVAIIFVLILIFVVGFIFTRKTLFNFMIGIMGKIPFINWFIGQQKLPQTINDMPGALVRFAEGSYYIAALVGEQKFKNDEGYIEILYKLYSPSAPIPWSGLPIIFARKEQVILLKITFRQVYAITTSFGSSTPAIIEEFRLTDN